MDLGLERIRRLLVHLGSPQLAYDVIHVAGTNGKGSICASLSSVLSSLPLRVGLFTSPHLIRPSDSLRLNDRPISPSLYSSALTHVASVDARHATACTSFELATAAALHLFRTERCDVAVVEVGLGGRLDATNVFDPPSVPRVCVISAIGLDHVAQLGPTVRDIAKEKCGILKKATVAVVAPQEFPEVDEVIKEEAEKAGTELVFVKPAEWADARIQSKLSFDNAAVKRAENHNLMARPAGPDGLERRTAIPPDHPEPPRLAHLPATSRHPAVTYPVVLPGDFQLGNSAAAVWALRVLAERGSGVDLNTPTDFSNNAGTASTQQGKYSPLTDPSTLSHGLSLLQWPGRLQWLPLPRPVSQRGWILLDGAHNEQAAKAVGAFVDTLERARTLRRGGRGGVTWALALASHKPPTEVIPHLVRRGDTVHLGTFPTPEGMPWVRPHPRDALVDVIETCGATVSGEIGGWDELRDVAQKAWDDSGVCVVAGSLYWVGEVARWMEGVSKQASARE
ncbi:Mur ligase [Gonapodya prolifera JEL478]|uniref:Mur ligase n=1 Tax=Gonapodya prolifera (strain JEL478) TaxID=1344416 RepID=A0A139AU65_GONPJ|nr:Mur ligase [Gonapodya prolifera JEL478]|eukprot:KXS20244.1 Mur ligase [Gonapodya prolifera JEL478]